MIFMTKKLKEVLERAEGWPQEAQEELARVANEIEGGLRSKYHATLEELRAIDDAQQSRVATEGEVEAALKSFRRA
jgi:2'-5' RNA ligase